jgi:hypothetical protein
MHSTRSIAQSRARTINRIQEYNVRIGQMETLIPICLGTFSAAAQNVDIEFDHVANFAKYHTFAIREGQLNSRNPALSNELVKRRIEADIEQVRKSMEKYPSKPK